MDHPEISLITYTYNDADLAAGLVRHVDSFTVKPAEIVVVDDGSDEPFRMGGAPGNLRVIRFERNQGITKAKGEGLSAGLGDYLLSMDCDTRVEPDWLERTLVHAASPQVGMVGGSGEHSSGDDLVSRYLSHFGDNHNRDGEVDFIPGNAFLMRREVWEHAGGFTGYGDTNCEDHYLCARLRKLGYTLFSDAHAVSRHLRRIARTTLCKRVWRWCHRPVKRQLAEFARAGGPQNVADYLFTVLTVPMIERSERISRLNEPLFYYIELLYLAHTVLDCLDHLVWHGIIGEPLRRSFIAALTEFFAGYPRLRTLLHADMGVLGHDLRHAEYEVDPVWNDLFLFGDALRNAGVLGWLEHDGVSLLIKEEMEERFDFSSYDAASFAV